MEEEEEGRETTIYLCRICHEEEESSSTSMESPCSCSGTLKFAHRDCIQRWCDEKGSTICEICLQNFEPGYTVAAKMALIEVRVTIRDSLEISRLNYQTRVEGSENISEEVVHQRKASYCRSVAAAFTIFLLLRHLIAMLSNGADTYAFTLLTVFLLRATGILLPFFLVMRLINAIYGWQPQAQPLHETQSWVNDEEVDEQHAHIIGVPV